MQKPPAVLVEHNVNDMLLFSPQDNIYSTSAHLNTGAGSWTPRSQACKSLETTSNQADLDGHLESLLQDQGCFGIFTPNVGVKKHVSLQVTVERDGSSNSADIENISM